MYSKFYKHDLRGISTNRTSCYGHNSTLTFTSPFQMDNVTLMLPGKTWNGGPGMILLNQLFTFTQVKIDRSEEMELHSQVVSL